MSRRRMSSVRGMLQNEKQKILKKNRKDDAYVMLFLQFLSFVFLLVCLCVGLRAESTVQRQKIHRAIHCQTKIEQRQKQTAQEHISGHERNPSFQTPFPPQWSPQPPCPPHHPHPDHLSLFGNFNSVQRDFREGLKVRAKDRGMLYRDIGVDGEVVGEGA